MTPATPAAQRQQRQYRPSTQTAAAQQRCRHHSHTNTIYVSKCTRFGASRRAWYSCYFSLFLFFFIFLWLTKNYPFLCCSYSFFNVFCRIVSPIAQFAKQPRRYLRHSQHTTAYILRTMNTTLCLYMDDAYKYTTYIYILNTIVHRCVCTTHAR